MSANRKSLWAPPTKDDWYGTLRSVVFAHDFVCRPTRQLRAAGLGSDDAAVQRLTDAFDGALNEIEEASAVLQEARRRLLLVAGETTPG